MIITCNTWALKQTVAPAAEPVTRAEAQAYCRVTDGTEDTLFENWIKTARTAAEHYTRRAFITQTWRLTLDYFPTWRIQLPRPSLIAVSSVTYINESGTQTVSSSDYRIDADHEPGILEPAIGDVWPAAGLVSGSVKVTYTAGYGASGSSVPEDIKDSIKWFVAWKNENREATEIPQAFFDSLDNYRDMTIYGYDD